VRTARLLGAAFAPREGRISFAPTLAAYDHPVPYNSPPDLLILHALRLMGMAEDKAVARRFGLDQDLVSESLLDHQAVGRVERVGFADLGGWALTALGHAEHERLLADELTQTGLRTQIASGHDRFVELNRRFLTAVTNWQIRPLPGDPLAANDHSDWRWDDRVLADLRSLLGRVRPLCSELEAELARFRGYPERLAHALDMVDKGERAWIDRPRGDSFHGTWFELHEDLLATLAITRGQPESS
jgi:hypothetical protein